jgi:hypothetical protein
MHDLTNVQQLLDELPEVSHLKSEGINPNYGQA